MPEIAFIWPWVGHLKAWTLNIMVSEGPGLGTGIALPGTHPAPTTPGTPLPPHPPLHLSTAWHTLQQQCVGLISVAQLTLSAHFSRFRGITEVYNLSVAGNTNDHKGIAGNK